MNCKVKARKVDGYSYVFNQPFFSSVWTQQMSSLHRWGEHQSGTRSLPPNKPFFFQVTDSLFLPSFYYVSWVRSTMTKFVLECCIFIRMWLEPLDGLPGHVLLLSIFVPCFVSLLDMLWFKCCCCLVNGLAAIYLLQIELVLSLLSGLSGWLLSFSY